MTRRTLTPFRDLPINKKLLAAYLSIFIITLLLGSTVLYSLVRTTIEHNIEQELKNTTMTILSMVRTAARVSIKNHLRAAAEQNLEIITQIHRKQLRGLLTEDQAQAQAREILMGQTIGKTGYIYCVDSHGIATVHPKPGMEGGTFLNHGFVREQIQRKEGYLEYEWKNPDETVERPKALYMTYFKPWDWIISVSSYRQEFSELINVSDFRDSILSLRFGETGYSYILDSAGRLIVHPVLRGNAFDFADAPGQDFIRTIIDEKKGKLVYSWQNPGERTPRDKLVIFNYIPEYDWIVASSCYLEESYAPLEKIRNVIFATVALILILTVPITWLMSNYIVRPMRKLMDNFRRGAGGDLSVRMNVTSDDEMGQLAGYFNYFMEKLQRSNRTLIGEMQEREQAEAELKVSEEKYRTILERMEEGYYEVDKAGRFTFFNASMQGILGYSKEELTGLDIREISEPETYRQIFKTFQAIRATGKPVKTANCKLIRGDGTQCLLETSISLLENPDGQCIGYRGVLKDITEKKKAESALRRSEEMFSKAFRSSPSGMFIVTLKDRRFIDVNDSFMRFTGFAPEEVIGKSLAEADFFEPVETIDMIMNHLLQGEAVRNVEVDFRSAGGGSHMGILSAEILVLKNSRCMLAALEDVTDTRRLENEILDISESERRRIGRTLHDDLCPHLLGVEVLSNVLRQKLDEKGLPEAGDAGKIQALIQDSIHKMKRLSRGLYPVDLTGGEFDAAIADLTAHAQDIFGVRCCFRCDLPVNIASDASAVHGYYIAHEALHNAIKHARARNILVSLSMNNGHALLTIEDDGTGMPAAQPQQGMGVRIMRYRAKRMGADLRIGSNAQGGTTVTLTMQNSMIGPPSCEHTDA